MTDKFLDSLESLVASFERDSETDHAAGIAARVAIHTARETAANVRTIVREELAAAGLRPDARGQDMSRYRRDAEPAPGEDAAAQLEPVLDLLARQYGPEHAIAAVERALANLGLVRGSGAQSPAGQEGDEQVLKDLGLPPHPPPAPKPGVPSAPENKLQK